MSIKTSRILSLGLFMSSMVVMGLDVWSPDILKTSQSPEALVENIAELEIKIDELEDENRRIEDELDRLTEGYSNTLTLSDVEGQGASTSQSDDSDETVTTSSDENKKEVREFTVTVKEGEPSSVVAEQLESLGVIDDRYDFNEYLETNDLAKKVLPGNYVVTSDMTNSQLAQAIIR